MAYPVQIRSKGNQKIEWILSVFTRGFYHMAQQVTWLEDLNASTADRADNFDATRWRNGPETMKSGVSPKI